MDQNRLVMKVMKFLFVGALEIRTAAACYGWMKRTPAVWLQAMLDDTV